MRRWLRRVVLPLSVVALFATAAPAAHAASTLTATVTGAFTLSACAGLGLPPLDIEVCAYTSTASTCVAAEASTKKIAVLNAGACSISTTGTVTGTCLLMTGTGTGTLTLGSQTFRLEFVLTGVSGTAVFTGTMTKLTTGQRGPMAAVGDYVFPTALTTPAGGSCVSGTAAFFTWVGAITSTML